MILLTVSQLTYGRNFVHIRRLYVLDEEIILNRSLFIPLAPQVGHGAGLCVVRRKTRFALKQVSPEPTGRPGVGGGGAASCASPERQTGEKNVCQDVTTAKRKLFCPLRFAILFFNPPWRR
jgi:hypothetical protein